MYMYMHGPLYMYICMYQNRLRNTINFPKNLGMHTLEARTLLLAS